MAGRPPTMEDTVRITINVPRALRDDLKEMADLENVSLSGFLRNLLLSRWNHGKSLWSHNRWKDEMADSFRDLVREIRKSQEAPQNPQSLNGLEIRITSAESSAWGKGSEYADFLDAAGLTKPGTEGSQDG